MVAETYDAAMVRVFADEGGYTNDPKDPGGPTNWGITIFDARKYWKAGATAEDVRAMPKAVAAVIYRKHYADPILYDSLPAGMDYSVFDAGINSGLGRAIPWVGKAANANTPITTASAAAAYANNAKDKADLIQKYWAVRLSFLHGLRTWSHFGTGWGRRCAQGEAAAVKMWLSIGAKLAPVDVGKNMNAESKKAATKAKKAATAGAGSTVGTATPAHPSVDVGHMGLGGKVLIGIFIAGLVVLAIYFIRQAVIHSQRSTAYATA